MDWKPVAMEILWLLAPVIVGVLATLLTVGLKRLNDWLRLRIGNETLKAAMIQVNDSVVTTVADIEKETRAYMSDGKLSREEARVLKDMAVKRVMG